MADVAELRLVGLRLRTVAESEHPNMERWTSFVREMATNTDLTTQLLIAHVPAGNGRCAACTRGGYGTSLLAWPCTVWKLAEAARAFRRTLAQGDTSTGRAGQPQARER
jgi:hypothetical protein